MNILAQIGFIGPLILLVLIIVFSLKENIPKLLSISPELYIIIIILWQIANYILNISLKLIIKEKRPPSSKSINIIDSIKDANDYGMPSGHAQLMFSQLTFIILMLKNKVLIFISILQTILTVLQRYKYKKHTLKQLIVGGLIGITTGYLITYILGIIRNKHLYN